MLWSNIILIKKCNAEDDSVGVKQESTVTGYQWGPSKKSRICYQIN